MLLFEPGVVSEKNGFRMEDYYIWGGSIIKTGEKYQMFASRWPRETGFPEGYLENSEIVRAEAGQPCGPYQFKEVVIARREGDFWDSIMAHNPSIVKYGNKYILYYIGRNNPQSFRKIGYAVADDIAGPWQRTDKALKLTEDANNPAPLFERDGSVKLVFRDRNLRMHLATADHFADEYTISSSDLVPGIKLEDPCLFFERGKYHIICEDNQARISGQSRWGIHLESKAGIRDWQPARPLIAYNHTVTMENGEKETFERRERPQLLFDRDGRVSHLITAVLKQGRTKCMVEPVVRVNWN